MKTACEKHMGLPGAMKEGGCGWCLPEEPRVGDTLHPDIPGRALEWQARDSFHGDLDSMGRGLVFDASVRRELRSPVVSLATTTPAIMWVRCPTCGGGCEFSDGLWNCADMNDNCMTAGEAHEPHEVWRRWGDTDKVAGEYWYIGRAGTLAVVNLNADDTHMFSDYWVIGPLPQPKVPK